MLMAEPSRADHAHACARARADADADAENPAAARGVGPATLTMMQASGRRPPPGAIDIATTFIP
jgi:hypothetical protein